MLENFIIEAYTLKHENTFAIFDPFGNIEPAGRKEGGIFYNGTRYLSKYQMFLWDKRPLLLSSSIKDDNSIFIVDLTNQNIFLSNNCEIPEGSIHILRNKFLYENNCYEKIYLENFTNLSVNLELTFYFDSDFADIFEIRGFRRKKPGEKLLPQIKKDKLILSYKGIDNKIRKTLISFSINPEIISSDKVLFKISLKPKSHFTFYILISCLLENEKPTEISYKKALFYITNRIEKWNEETCEIYTSNEQFNLWVKRSWSDIVMLISKTSEGPYPFAGIPWFSTPFGRDGIITSLECLWINPSIAKGTLSFLASTQAKKFDISQDAQPGKIIHEIRKGELAEAKELPYALYYGSIDATPLFIILAGLYYDRTGDLEFIEHIWTNILMAMEWIENYGDLDKDGFIEYVACEKGLKNKGWKDSGDSVFHANGELAEPPIALVEVQGYVYKAKIEGAKLADVLGKKELALKWRKSAEGLKNKINKTFWCDEISFYGMALDKNKNLCKVRTSNAGHLLFTQVVPFDKAKKIVSVLFEKHFFSGWGIRTVSSLEKRYNPLSYHNGSVWPHDNAIIAYGLAQYGFKNEAMRILKALFEASTFFKLHRLPELFCGFSRRPNEGPTHYPVACHPQAWAAGAVFLLLQACLGLSFNRNIIKFHHPVLPKFLDEIWIKNLKVKNGKVDLYLKRFEKDVVINVINKEGDVRISIEK